MTTNIITVTFQWLQHGGARWDVRSRWADLTGWICLTNWRSVLWCVLGVSNTTDILQESYLGGKVIKKKTLRYKTYSGLKSGRCRVNKCSVESISSPDQKATRRWLSQWPVDGSPRTRSIITLSERRCVHTVASCCHGDRYRSSIFASSTFNV